MSCTNSAGLTITPQTLFPPPLALHKTDCKLAAVKKRIIFSSRYGLPVNFQAMLLQPNKKTVKKLREVLNDLYKHLDSSAAAIIDVSTSVV